MNTDQKDKIRELRADGFGYSAIADALGLTKNQVSAYCRRNNLSGTKSDARSIESVPTDCCRNCGKPLTQHEGRKTVKFCSDACRVSWWNTHQNMVNRKAIYDFRCAHCGKPFSAYGNAHRKYCSHECYIEERFGGGHDE